MPDPRLVLASTSPRRRDLLALLGIPFEVASPEVPETPGLGESPSNVVQRLSLAKARAYAGDSPDAAVIAADTIVVLDDRILGKPVDAADAARMLRELRGRAHQVFSGVAVVAADLEESAVIETVVWMRDYSDAEIERYVQSGDPLDKAGAYAIQHAAFHPVARIEGCPLNVMGLPLCHIDRMLRRLALLQAASPLEACHPPFFCALAKTTNAQRRTTNR